MTDINKKMIEVAIYGGIFSSLIWIFIDFFFPSTWWGIPLTAAGAALFAAYLTKRKLTK